MRQSLSIGTPVTLPHGRGVIRRIYRDYDPTCWDTPAFGATHITIDLDTGKTIDLFDGELEDLLNGITKAIYN